MSSRMLVIAIFLYLTACSSRGIVSERKSCPDVEFCSVTGVLEVFPGQPAWGVVISLSETTCAKIAFPNELLPKLENLEGEVVTVEGASFNQPSSEIDGEYYLWYEERGRRLPFGVCDDGMGVFANKLIHRNRVVWLDAAR